MDSQANSLATAAHLKKSLPVMLVISITEVLVQTLWCCRVEVQCKVPWLPPVQTSQGSAHTKGGGHTWYGGYLQKFGKK